MDEAHLRRHLLAMADDELILGHRDSEWCGHAPILEEDIAFANLALDELGHAALLYGLLAELDGQDPDAYAHRMVYFREAAEYRCAQLVELPNGDWAFSMLRQYLFDSAEKVRMAHLSQCSYPPAAQISQRILNEELYHHRHTSAWVRRLALGTDESHARMQNALDLIWPYTAQLFSIDSDPGSATPEGTDLDPVAAGAEWEAAVHPFLQACDLAVPDGPRLELSRREHTLHLTMILAEMQSLARQEPEARW